LLISHHQAHGHVQKVLQRLNIWLLVAVVLVVVLEPQLVTEVVVVVLVDIDQELPTQ
jgi:hypothetical protein